MLRHYADFSDFDADDALRCYYASAMLFLLLMLMPRAPDFDYAIYFFSIIS